MNVNYCPECGFDASQIDVTTVGERIRENTSAWGPVLSRADVRRPNGHTWSPLEYAAHVRDVHRVYNGRLKRFLAEDHPMFANWDQDETAIAERYNEQDPAQVGTELADAAEEMASGFDAVPAGAWSRTAERSDGATFTLESFARYYLHDLVHHRWDVEH